MTPKASGPAVLQIEPRGPFSLGEAARVSGGWSQSGREVDDARSRPHGGERFREVKLRAT